MVFPIITCEFLKSLTSTLSQMEIYPASKETIVKPGILTKAFWVCIQTVAMALTSLVQTEKKLEVSTNVKYIAATSRASKLQIFKVRPGWDLNPGHPHESLNI